MRIFLAGLVLAAALAGSIALNGYRASAASTVTPPKSSTMRFVPDVPPGAPFTVVRRWKPGWVAPAVAFLAIGGAAGALAVGIGGHRR